MNNLDTYPPSYSTLDVPNCKTKQKSNCNQTPGCQLYDDECVPKVQETIASLYQGRAADVQRTLSAVTGRDCARQFREMYQTPLDSVDARENRNRTMAAMLARNMSDGATDWTNTSKQDIEGFLDNPGCVICSEASEEPFGRMRCCGTPVHEQCFVRWYEGKDLEGQRCVACRRLPAFPFQFSPDNDDPSLLLPERRMDANRRYPPTGSPIPPPNPVQHADVTINATNGECPIGQLTGGSLCTVDAELAKKIHVVVYYKDDDSITSPQGQEIYDLVRPIFGAFRPEPDVDLNMDTFDDRVVEREARANRTRARINYVFTNVFPNIQFQHGAGLMKYASLRTVLPVSLRVLNSKLRSTRLETLRLTTDGGIQGNDGDVEDMCRILHDTPLLYLSVANFNISIEAGFDLLRRTQCWQRNYGRFGGGGGIYKTGYSRYYKTYLRVASVDGVNTLEFQRMDCRPRGLGYGDFWRTYWANLR